MNITGYSYKSPRRSKRNSRSSQKYKRITYKESRIRRTSDFLPEAQLSNNFKMLKENNLKPIISYRGQLNMKVKPRYFQE